MGAKSKWCYWCRRELTEDPWCDRKRTRDHVVALGLGGGNGRPNIVDACQACNNLKGDMPLREWRIVMRDIPEWWRLACYRGPRGRQLSAAMHECGFDFSRASNGQPFEAWWENKPEPVRRPKWEYRKVMYVSE